jgi:hypothetical protein
MRLATETTGQHMHREQAASQIQNILYVVLVAELANDLVEDRL